MDRPLVGVKIGRQGEVPDAKRLATAQPRTTEKSLTTTSSNRVLRNMASQSHPATVQLAVVLRAKYAWDVDSVDSTTQCSCRAQAMCYCTVQCAVVEAQTRAVEKFAAAVRLGYGSSSGATGHAPDLRLGCCRPMIHLISLPGHFTNPAPSGLLSNSTRLATPCNTVHPMRYLQQTLLPL